MSSTLSPFHQGEKDAQTRVGVRDMAEALGRQMVRDFMPDQHRDFYNQLPLLFVGSVDEMGRPWASVVVGKPGFVSSPDSRSLRFDTTLLPFDPLSEGLKVGAQLGLLGLEFHTRRRNRMNGEVVRVDDTGFEMKVGQSFGNCPQYIQKRQLRWRKSREPESHSGVEMRADVRALISSADTFFVASTYDKQGTDMSHRGGKPGFVKIESDRTLVFPDFRGNNHFNTIGNLLVNPKAGLLFFDFQSGDVLHLTAEAEIIWDGPEVEAFVGAQRLVRFRVSEWRLVKKVFPFSWDFQEFSPTLDATGTWAEKRLRAYSVERIVQESAHIKSFYLSPTDGGALPDFRPGQHLPIHLDVNKGESLVRTYSLSQPPGRTSLRLTVKLEERGIGSGFLHNSVKVGDTIKAGLPAGEFVLDSPEGRPVVLLSAGVGITPMMSMLGRLSETDSKRKIYFIHGARRGSEHALRIEVEALATDNVSIHFRYSQPEDGDRYDSTGRVDVELLQSLLPFGNYDFYLCGPASFLKSLYDGLRSLGVPREQIRFESFGTPLELEQAAKQSVEFRSSGKTVDWEGGSLLELAEKNGISAPFSCRGGACGACRQRVLSGEVEYTRTPTFELNEGEVLLCSARPDPDSDEILSIDL